MSTWRSSSTGGDTLRASFACDETLQSMTSNGANAMTATG
jgi:hypothetical protein